MASMSILASREALLSSPRCHVPSDRPPLLSGSVIRTYISISSGAVEAFDELGIPHSRRVVRILVAPRA